jgi:excisionase family DNA binding protein
MTFNRLLRENEAAHYLGISLSTIKRKRYNREIEHYQVGSRIRYSVEEHLAPFLKRCECKLADSDDMGLEP